jgi:transcriptional regulator of acetoin/glycerol metabolism
MPLQDENGAMIGAIGFVLYERLDSLKPLVAKFAKLHRALADAQERLVEGRRPRYSLGDYVGSSPAALEVKRLARRAAEQDTTALVHGETGTGKELIGRTIHDSSSRRHKPFVGINVAAVPETLESVLTTRPAKNKKRGQGGRDNSFTCATCRQAPSLVVVVSTQLSISHSRGRMALAVPKGENWKEERKHG